MIEFLKDNWNIVSANPLFSIVFFILSAGTGLAFGKAYYSQRVAVLEEKYKLAKDQTDKLSNTINVQIQQLKDEAVRNREELLSKLPKVYVQKEEPKDMKEGDIWIVD